MNDLSQESWYILTEGCELPGRSPSFSNSSKKYFVYARVSKIDYVTSVATQKKILISVAKRFGIAEERLIFKTETKSGSKKVQRVHFDEMVKALMNDISTKNIRNREYGGILFYKVDRLFRNFQDYNKIEKILDAGYDFISATETIENTPTGKLLFRMLASFAIYETEKLSNRESVTHLQNIIKKDFKKLGWHSVFWYGFNETTKQLAVIESEARVIRIIYALRSSGLGVTEIYSEISKNAQLGFETIIEKRLAAWIKAREEREKKRNGIDGTLESQDESEKLNDSEEESEEDVEEFLSEETPVTNDSSEAKKPLPQRRWEKLIYSILENERYMRYNGTITRQVKINDELIRDAIRSLLKDEILDMEWRFSLDGENEIGGKIKFTFVFPELCIVDQKIYESVQSHLEKREKRDTNNELAMFDNMLFSNTDNTDSSPFGWYPKRKPNRYTIYYRKQVNFKKEEISEQKIEKAIIRSKIFEKAKDINYWEDTVRDYLAEQYKSITRPQLEYLQARKMLAERSVNELSDHIDHMLANPNENQKKQDATVKNLTSQLRTYNSIIQWVSKELVDIREVAWAKIWKYIHLIRDNMEIEDRQERCLAYKIAFERIILVFNSSKEPKEAIIVFTPIMSAILCTEKEITISLM